MVWRSLDPYGWKCEISTKFLKMWAKFTDIERQNIKFAWTESAETLVFLMNRGELPLLFNEQLQKNGIKCGSNRWFELGYILATVNFTLDPDLRVQKSDQIPLMMAAVQLNPLAAHRADLSQSWDLAYLAVQGRGEFLEEIVAGDTNDYYKFCIAAVQSAGECAFKYIPEQYLAEKPIAMSLASISPETINWTRDLYALPDYKQIALRCISVAPEGWTAYISLPHYLQTDPDIVLAVFKDLPRSLPQFGVLATTLYDHELVQKAIAIHGLALSFAPPHLQASKRLVSLALDTYALAIGYASSELKADRDLAIKALLKDGRVYPILSSDLQEDYEIVSLAVKSDGSAIDCMPQQSDNFELALVAVETSPRSLQLLSERLRDNVQVVLRAVRADGLSLEYVSLRLRKDRLIVHQAIRQEPLAMEFADAAFQDDIETVLMAIQYDVRALEWASPRVIEDRRVIMAAVGFDSWAIKYIPEKCVDREVILSLLKTERIDKTQLLPHVQDREVVLAAVRKSGSLLAVCPKFSDDEEIVEAAVKNDGSSLIYGSTRLQRNSDFELMAAISYKGMHRGDYLQQFIP